jgi:hypothetical protein
MLYPARVSSNLRRAEFGFIEVRWAAERNRSGDFGLGGEHEYE